MNKIKLFVVDDHTIVRDGIMAMLIGDPEIEIAGDFGSGCDLFPALNRAHPDVVLLDITLPGLSGIEIAKLIHEAHPQMGILMLSALSDESSIIQSIKAGAKGFLPKDIDKKELRKAILEVHKGNRYFGSVITQTIFDCYIQNIVSKVDISEEPHLTDREIEIIKQFCNGLLYKEIADQLGISIKTVESHKAKIMSKLELKSTVDLVKYAINKRIIVL
ncbi:response regulator transcription factor [Reichenbachiella agarivorans]|uniref:Response regulator transcription factor n=1 Tax=Reichenbachiella agarivorans TaxID=2979464 RepID=A0ABY6CM77_9BACT|nr:response regulator transcription factor [Reichenbachiella agarivorans]UXP31606.1 response regulator transcription factor [Reichenbachiella agarivorans]